MAEGAIGREAREEIIGCASKPLLFFSHFTFRPLHPWAALDLLQTIFGKSEKNDHAHSGFCLEPWV